MDVWKGDGSSHWLAAGYKVRTRPADGILDDLGSVRESGMEQRYARMLTSVTNKVRRMLVPKPSMVTWALCGWNMAKLQMAMVAAGMRPA